jgi:hypothetical protein
MIRSVALRRATPAAGITARPNPVTVTLILAASPFESPDERLTPATAKVQENICFSAGASLVAGRHSEVLPILKYALFRVKRALVRRGAV